MKTERLYMTLYMCFIETLVIACTVSDILDHIDHKGRNWTFLTLKSTCRVIPRLSYFRTGLVSHNKFEQNLLLNIIDNDWKMGQT